VRWAGETVLPTDAVQMLRRRGNNLYVGVIHPGASGGAERFELVNDFGTRNDIIGAVDASTYIPLWSGPTTTVECAGAGRGGGGGGGGGCRALGVFWRLHGAVAAAAAVGPPLPAQQARPCRC
jgi:hypothetical protein